MRKLLIVILTSYAVTAFSQKNTKTENIILITLDGMRWQEIFNGAEKRLIQDRNFVSDSARINNKFWNESAAKRRELLMPFLWSTIQQQGQIYGNRSLGNKVNVSNNQWFSYPGYNEILTGSADNERIHSNDKFDNPNKNVLEFVNNQKGYTGKVAAFTSWDVFPYIINTKRNSVYVNSGLIETKGNLSEYEKFLNEMMWQVPNPLGDVRLDAFTYHYGLEHLKKNKTKVLYLAFDETDDFAHGGKYDLYLEAANHIDGFIKSLWEFLQSTEGYKGKTTIILATDHGRGNKDKSDWRDHGSDKAESDQIWLAFLGPDTQPVGEVKTEGQLYQNQIAKTLAAFLGKEYTNDRKPGDLISSALTK